MPEAAFQTYKYDTSPSVNQENQNQKLSAFWGKNAVTQSNLENAEPDQAQDQIRKTFFVSNREGAFTQSDLVSTEDDQAQELIEQIRKSPYVSNQERFADQLITLFNFAKEESPASPGISIKSLSSFYDFIMLNTIFEIPTLSLSPDHNVYISWRAENRLFSLHFLPDGDIRFVLFKPNDKHSNRKIRVTGTVTGDTLKEIIAPDSLNDWVFGER